MIKFIFKKNTIRFYNNMLYCSIMFLKIIKSLLLIKNLNQNIKNTEHFNKKQNKKLFNEIQKFSIYIKTNQKIIQIN